MTASLKHLHPDDILQMSASSAVALNVARLVAPQLWTQTGQDGVHLWGLCADTGKANVAIHLALLNFPEVGMKCGCREVQPCGHTLALLMLFRERPQLFPLQATPRDVLAKLPVRPEPQPPVNMRDEVARGLSQLQAWLTGMIRHGLGEPHVREFPFWDSMATRMQAAWMPELAQWLRDIANIPVRGGNWTEVLLDELGRLYLLTRSFERFDALPPETQADMRAAVGWRLTPDEYLPSAVTDNWLVTGSRHRLVLQEMPQQTSWLYGVQSGRMALLHETGAEAVLKMAGLETGTMHALSLSYLPSRAPLRAVLTENSGPVEFSGVRGSDIASAVSQSGRALALNPWQRQLPILLDGVYIARFHKGWIVRHADGTFLPIAPYFVPKWALYGISGGHPMQVAGLWNGSVLFPQSVISDGRVVELSSIRHYRQ